MGDPNRRMFSPEIEAMPREDIERLQEEKLLGDLVPWAYERSGLIRETWDAAGVKRKVCNSRAFHVVSLPLNFEASHIARFICKAG